jgi:hypothetical protein
MPSCSTMPSRAWVRRGRRLNVSGNGSAWSTASIRMPIPTSPIRMRASVSRALEVAGMA